MLDYEERLVAYVNILGFEALMQRSVGPERTITPAEIKEALDVPKLAESGQIIFGRIGDFPESGHRMTSFSGIVAITVHPTATGLLHLLHHVARIGYRLIRKKIFCRGGIIRGPVCHDGQNVFGPALYEARRLERRRARYPRVILDESVTKVALAAEPPVDKIISRFVRQDDDGLYFVNTLRIIRMMMDFENEPPGDVRALLDEIGQHLRQEIARLAGEEQEQEQEQMLWFKKYFDWARDKGNKDL